MSIVTVLVYNIFMRKVSLRKIRISDAKYFLKWWRDAELIKLTSGNFALISDKKIEKSVSIMAQRKNEYHFMLMVDKKVIGHIALVRRIGGWYETQIVIGEKEYWSSGYGSRAIKLLLKKANKDNISKIYLEVRPSNARAIKAYKKCGFTKAEIIKYPQNKYLPRTLRMEFESSIVHI